jgi:hypothetical protein
MWLHLRLLDEISMLSAATGLLEHVLDTKESDVGGRWVRCAHTRPF